MGIRLPICIALALAGTIQVSANVTDMRCEYRLDHYIPAFFYPCVLSTRLFCWRQSFSHHFP